MPKGDVFYVVLECTTEDDEERPTKTAEAIADSAEATLVGTFAHCDYYHTGTPMHKLTGQM